MPSCPNCNAKVAFDDKRCRKCGCKLESPIPKFNWKRVEFILAVIAVFLTLLSFPSGTGFFGFSILIHCLVILFGIIGAFTIKKYARSGAVILMFSLIFLFVSNPIGAFLPAVFYILAIILAFVKN